MGMPKKVRKAVESKCTVAEGKFRYIFLPLALLLVVWHLVPLYMWSPSLWGIHSLYFFPRWLCGILILIAVDFFIPPVNNFVLKLFDSLLDFVQKIPSQIGKRRFFLVCGILSLPVFWLLKTKLFLLGDGYLKISDVVSGRLTYTEPLDGIIHHQFYLLLNTLHPGINPSFSYTILSVLGGGIFIFLILELSDLLGETTFTKILIFSSLFTLASLELFFGYVESYSILLVGLTLFILLSLLYLNDKINIIFVFLVLCFSIGIHVSAIVLIPAFLYLIYWKWRKREKRYFDPFSAISLLGCLAITFAAIWKVFLMEGPNNRFGQFIPLYSAIGNKFTLFSPAHIGEMVNQLLLVSPVGILLFLFFLYYMLKSKSFRDPFLNFLLISALAGLFLIFVYNAHLGIADWDLRSLPGIFVSLLGMLLFLRWGSRWVRFKNYGLILIAVSLFHLIPWILLNANAQMSLDRYIMSTLHDPHLLYVRGGGIWRAGRVVVQAGFPERAVELLKEGMERDPEEIGNYSYIAVILSGQKRWDESIYYLQKALKVEPNSRIIRSHLARIYLIKGELDQAISALGDAQLAQPSDSILVLDLAKPLIKGNRLKEAKQILQNYLEKNEGTASLHGLWGLILFMQKDTTDAQTEWEEALRLNPNEPVSLKGMKELEKTRVK
jgi:Flp pilus assembly protein TadD